ncbi:MAG: hypothetical protein ACK5TN_14405, partial [Acidobacteriota bacterium]
MEIESLPTPASSGSVIEDRHPAATNKSTSKKRLSVDRMCRLAPKPLIMGRMAKSEKEWAAHPLGEPLLDLPELP